MIKITKYTLLRALRRSPGVRFASIIAIVVLGFGAVGSFLLFRIASSQYDENHRLLIDRQSSLVVTYLHGRFDAYRDLLRSACAVAQAKDGDGGLTTVVWSHFVETMQSGGRYPEASMIGYGAYLPSGSDKGSFIETVRTEYPNFTISPSLSDSDQVVVRYYEPYSAANSRAIGYDMYSEKIRRDALERARDTGEASLTGPIVFKSDQQQGGVQPLNVALFMPIYASGVDVSTVGARRASIRGYAFIGLSVSEVIKAASDLSGGSQIYLIDTRTPTQRFYSSGNSILAAAPNERSLSVAGRDWKIGIYVQEQPFSKVISPLLLFIGGIMATVVLSTFTFMVLLRRMKSVQVGHHRALQQSKNDVLALASHQLRTPAAAVRQYVGMLMQGYIGDLSDEQHGVVRKAYLANERQLQVIDQMLYVAKADAGQLLVKVVRADIVGIIKSAVEDMAEFAMDHKVRVKLRLSRRRMLCLVDEQYTHMIIENLLSNAIKYSYAKSEVTVRLVASSQHIEVCVEDNGVGLRDDDIALLFQKFVRIPNELSVLAGGSGLGLFLSQQMARVQGGDISVRSQIAKGLVFILRLPKK